MAKEFQLFVSKDDYDYFSSKAEVTRWEKMVEMSYQIHKAYAFLELWATRNGDAFLLDHH